MGSQGKKEYERMHDHIERVQSARLAEMRKKFLEASRRKNRFDREGAAMAAA